MYIVYDIVLQWFGASTSPWIHDGSRGEQLAILGPERGRRGAVGAFVLRPRAWIHRPEELKVMSSVEEKSPGQYTRGIREKFSDARGFATDRMVFKDGVRHPPSSTRLDLSQHM